ncbi:hypothetical protein D3C71_1368910 [compost metagenome]
MYKQGIGAGKIGSHFRHRNSRQEEYIVELSAFRKCFQPGGLNSPAQEDKRYLTGLFLQQLCSCNDCIKRLRLAHISSKQNSKLRSHWKIGRWITRSGTNHIFGTPVVDDIDFLRRHSPLDQ